jgi:uncharacterized protein YbaP (TraB family)
MSKRIDELLAAEAAAAEAFEEDQSAPYPEHVKITRSPRSKVLQVRLNPEELEALERIAARRQLPVSTIAREQLLKLIAERPVSQLQQLIAAVTEAKSLADQLDSRAVGLPKQQTDASK